MIAGVLRKIIVVMIGGNLKISATVMTIGGNLKTSTIVMMIGGNLKTSTIVMMIGGNLKTSIIVMTIGSSIEISVVVTVSLFVAIVKRNIGKIFSTNLKAKNMPFGLINTRL
ncbi:hypothetical protein BK737_15715 [Bacillus thuringiensis serovar palmanyolensis]|uniref:hypothetical protein n=1 Tax=Bacillus thuringiensis TaxID=1428 RepID=UPI000A39EB3B|nr:hypothetical protein BK737_15715 [Bacillus thuringiensis serovar palmanyolensis]